MTWYDADPGRLVLEHCRVKQRFPNFSLKKKGKELLWQGTQIVSLRGENLAPLEIQVFYPEAFPCKPPKVEVLTPSLPPDEVGHSWHRWVEGNICFIQPREWQISTTTEEVIAKVADWYHNYMAVKLGLVLAMPDIGRADV